MVSREDVTELLLYIGGGWPEREISDPVKAFWHRQLHEVALADAMAAVDSLVATGQVHYPRPAEVLNRCPQPWPNGKLYARFAKFRSKVQGEKVSRHGYRGNGKLTPAECREYEQLLRQLGVTA